ncbi:MAG: 3'-5' exonuclease, partial [Cellulosilyticaceae bacterium]
MLSILEPKKAMQIALTKSYRSTYEINTFTQKLRGLENVVIPFERHGEVPQVIKAQDQVGMILQIADQIKGYQEEGFESIAVLCKNQHEAQEVYEKLVKHVAINPIISEDAILEKGVTIMPIYAAKGLEYDAVIVYGTDAKAYHNSFDQQLLYIACTRALHKLSLYYTGAVSPLL